MPSIPEPHGLPVPASTPFWGGAASAAASWLLAMALFALLAFPAGAGVEEADPGPAPGSGDAVPETSGPRAGEGPGDGAAPHLPSPVGEEDFRDLAARSPFSRSLNLSDSLILTGVAVVGGEQVATLLNKETKETFVVSARLNSQGWRMVEFSHDEDLEKVAAKVAVAGGEVVTVRYAEWQLKPGEAKPGAGPGEGGTISARAPRGERSRGDYRRGEGGGPPRGGPPGGPSPEMRERLSGLSEDQRTTLFQRMSEARERNPEMSWEERGRLMMQMADRLANQ